MKLLRPSIVIAFIILAVAALASAAPKDAVILLDASWSMQGFFETSSICGIVDDIRASLDGASFSVRNLSFKNTSFQDDSPPSAFANCREVHADGQVTLIDRAYQNALKRQPKTSVVWLITDNVQDPNPNLNQPNPENADIREFYGVLDRENVKRLYLFIRTPDFAGPVYGQDGTTRLDPHYFGKRGLLIYGILLDPAAADDFEKTIRLFAERSRRKVPADIAEGTPVKGFPNKSVNAAIEKVDAPRVTVRKSDNALVFQKVFREQEPIQGAFDVTFLNGPANLVVDRPEIEVGQQEGFKLYGDPHLSAEVPQVSAVPPQLGGKLLPPSSAAGTQRVRITVSFPNGVTFPHSLRSLWNYLWQPHAAVYKGSIKVGLRAKARDVDLDPAVIKSHGIEGEYFTSAAAQEKIYALKHLFTQLHTRGGETPISIPAEVIPVEFSVSPPQWPVVVLVILGILLTLMIVVLARSFGGRPFQLEPIGPYSYRLASGGQKTQVGRTSRRGSDSDAFSAGDGNSVPDLKRSIRLAFFGNHPIADENERLGNLRRKLSGITVTAAAGYVVNGSSEYRLPSRGGTFSFQKPAEVESNHHGPPPVREVSETKREASGRDSGGRRPRTRSGSDNFFG